MTRNQSSYKKRHSQYKNNSFFSWQQQFKDKPFNSLGMTHDGYRAFMDEWKRKNGFKEPKGAERLDE